MQANYWKKNYASLGRRRFLGATAAGAAGAAALGLVGCGDDDDDDESPSGSPTPGGATPAGAASGTPVPKRGGILEYGIDNLQDILDPHQTTRATYNNIWHNISHHLVGIDPKTGAWTDTEAAQTFEQADATTMIFKLWPGINWHKTADIDARPFTSKDVAYNILRQRDGGARFSRRSQFTAVDSVETPNDSTVVIRLKQPYVPMLYFLGSGYNVLVNPDADAKFGSIDRVSAASGIGPFLLKSVDKAAGAEMVRNPNYFRAGLPYLDGINIVGFPDAQSSVAAFRTGKIHTLQSVPISAESELRANVKGLQVFVSGSPSQYVGPGITTKQRPFDDLRVRRAISIAIDRHAMIAEAYQGQRAHLLAPVPWGHGDFAIPESELLQIPGYRVDHDADLKMATDLLASAGLKPQDIKVRTTAGNLSFFPPTYETLIPQLKKFGFDLSVDIQDNTQFRNFQTQKDYVWQWNLSLVDAEPDAVLRLFNYTGASRNYNVYSDKAVDALIDKQVAELNRDARIKLTREVSKQLIERPNWIQTANQEVLFMAQSFVREFRVAPAGITDALDRTRTWLDT